MEIRSARSLLAVAEAGTVTAAARALHITQPALSRQIRSLEHQLDLTLFDRRDSRMVPTSAGRQLIAIARDLVARADLADKAATALRAGALPEITICAPGTTLRDVIAPFLATWAPNDPMPSVWEALPPAIYASLGRGADLAIGTDPPPSTLSTHPVAVLPVWAYVPPDHQWSSRATVPVAHLVAEPLLVLPGEQHARRALDAVFTEAGVSPHSITEFDTPDVAQAVAAAGRGVAIVSDDARFDLVPVAITANGRKLVIRLFAAWTPDHHAAATLYSVAVRLSTFCLQRYGSEPV